MIPKIVHYCWFGPSEMPVFLKECVATWHKYLPDYTFMCWTQNNFNLQEYNFAIEAYQANKYAFVADVCRLAVLKEYGGVYLDTDVELLNNLDDFLHHTSFSGFEDNAKLLTGVIGSVAQGEWVSDMLVYYTNTPFVLNNGNYNIITNVDIVTEMMERKGIVLNNRYQEIENYVAFYSSDYFCPKSHIDGKITLTTNTIAIHHFSGSWLAKKQKVARSIRQFLRRLLGLELYFRLKRCFYFWKKQG